MATRWVKSEPLQTVYKYLPREFAEAMINEGKVKLGTLHDYRRQEALGRDIGDADEGTCIVFSEDAVQYADPSELAPFCRHFIKGNARHLRFEGIGFELRRESPDAYIFCCSSEFSESAMLRYGDSGYDACVRIHSPHHFFQEITKALHKVNISEHAIGTCAYLKRKFHHTRDSNIPPGFMKDPFYDWQKEVRAVWVLRNPESIPPHRILTCPGISEFCSLHYPQPSKHR